MKLEEFKKELAKTGVPYDLVVSRFDPEFGGCDTLEGIVLSNYSFTDIIHSLCEWEGTPEGFDFWCDVANERVPESRVNTLPTTLPTTRPKHYGGEENIFEPIKIIRHYGLGFELGNLIKYVLRADKKGDCLGDLKKAKQYLEWEISKLEETTKD